MKRSDRITEKDSFSDGIILAVRIMVAAMEGLEEVEDAQTLKIQPRNKNQSLGCERIIAPEDIWVYTKMYAKPLFDCSKIALLQSKKKYYYTQIQIKIYT